MAPRVGQGVARRRIAGGVVALALLAVPAAAAGAAGHNAHAASKTATSILRTTVPKQGKYLLIVEVRARGRHSRLVDVYVAGKPVRTVVANPWWGAAVYYTLNLSPTKLVVRAVNAPPAVQVRAKLSLRKGAKPGAPSTTSKGAPPSSSSSPPSSTTTTTTTPPPASTPTPYPSPYTNPVFSDDFQTDFTAGGSLPNQLPTSRYWNLDNWGGCGETPVPTISTSNTNDPGNGQNLDGVNADQNAYLTPQGLAITAVRNPNAVANSYAANTYTSAQVDSVGHWSGEYGEVEASIEMPTAQGLCPAFWMLGDSDILGSSPAIPGEIDVVEAPTFGAGIDDYADLHGTSVNGPNGATTQQYEVSAPAPSPGFHTYAIIWTPTSITWTLDGIAYASANQNALIAGSSWANDYSYGPFHLIFDLAVGGWPCDYGTCTPAGAQGAPSYTMYVQWVKWLQ
jgi:beta-glucanase (GH16 family)